MLLDFGNAAYAFVYGTVAGKVTEGFMPSLFGTDGHVVGTRLNDEDLRLPDDHQPHVVGPHAGMEESHVFEDLMQLVDWARDGKPSMATAEHARHVVEIIEAGYSLRRDGPGQELYQHLRSAAAGSPYESRSRFAAMNETAGGLSRGEVAGCRRLGGAQPTCQVASSTGCTWPVEAERRPASRMAMACTLWSIWSVGCRGSPVSRW